MRTRKYDAIFLGQWCYCIASRLWLLCLSVTGLCATLYIVAKWFKIGSRLGLGWHFSRYHFQHLMPPLNSKRAVDLGVQVWYWKFGQTVADRAKLCIDRHAFDRCTCPPTNPPLTPYHVVHSIFTMAYIVGGCALCLSAWKSVWCLGSLSATVCGFSFFVSTYCQTVQNHLHLLLLIFYRNFTTNWTFLNA